MVEGVLLSLPPCLLKAETIFCVHAYVCVHMQVWCVYICVVSICVYVYVMCVYVCVCVVCMLYVCCVYVCIWYVSVWLVVCVYVWCMSVYVVWRTILSVIPALPFLSRRTGLSLAWSRVGWLASKPKDHPFSITHSAFVVCLFCFNVVLGIQVRFLCLQGKQPTD